MIIDLADHLVEHAGGTPVIVQEYEKWSIFGRGLCAREFFPGEEGVGGHVTEAFAAIEAEVHGAYFGIEVVEGFEAWVDGGGVLVFVFAFAFAAGHRWELLCGLR